MANRTFFGGIHPYEGKELSKDKPIKTILPGSELVYPVSQHIGAPAEICVSAGSQVQRGDVIARMAEGALGADIHASICGTVDKTENGMIVIRGSTLSGKEIQS